MLIKRTNQDWLINQRQASRLKRKVNSKRSVFWAKTAREAKKWIRLSSSHSRATWHRWLVVLMERTSINISQVTRSWQPQRERTLASHLRNSAMQVIWVTLALRMQARLETGKLCCSISRILFLIKMYLLEWQALFQRTKEHKVLQTSEEVLEEDLVWDAPALWFPRMVSFKS